MNFQYPKFRNGGPRDRLRFGGDRFEPTNQGQCRGRRHMVASHGRRHALQRRDGSVSPPPQTGSNPQSAPHAAFRREATRVCPFPCLPLAAWAGALGRRAALDAAGGGIAFNFPRLWRRARERPVYIARDRRLPPKCRPGLCVTKYWDRHRRRGLSFWLGPPVACQLLRLRDLRGSHALCKPVSFFCRRFDALRGR
jgi:hypothetical protein